MEDEKYEEVGTIVFQTLNPILRNVLNTIEQMRTFDGARDHESAMALYKTQSESYQSIQKEIRRWSDEKIPRNLYCKALNEMQAFYFLPIVLTMQTKLMCIHDDGDKEVSNRLDMILNDAHLKALEEAAKSWYSYIEFVFIKTKDQSHVSDATMVLDPDLGMKLLTSATMAMRDIFKMMHTSSKDSLNVGDDCHQTILRAIESLMTSQKSSALFRKKIVTALHHNRSFAEMLVIACIRPLNDKIIQDHSSDLMDIKGNIELKLQSIRTLESLLLLQEDNDPDGSMIWRMFFPDIFMKLYQTAFVHVRFTTSVASPKLASESMRALSTLMKRALIIPSSMLVTPKDPLVALLSTPRDNDIVSAMDPEMKLFFERVHNIITKPLILLISVASSNPSKIVRSVLVHNICDTIINSTIDCWNLNIGVELQHMEATQPHLVPHAAVECIISGLVDENDNLSIQCIEIFNEFVNSLTAVQMSSWSRDIFLPRVLSQIETLPSLARSGRNSDLISTTRLIAGYLKAFLIMSNMNKGQGKSKTNLHFFLVTQLTTKEIRRCFVDCLIMDNFNSIKYGLIRSCESSQSLNLRYMNETSTKEFKFMIQMLSSFIGLKRAMLYIDGCISDLFDGLSSRIRNQRLVYDTEHSRWMETYFGNGVLVYFILSTMGSFSLNSKRLKHIESLTKAILPIIFSDEIWKLPTTHECAKLLGATTTSCSSHENMFKSSDVEISATSKIGTSFNITQHSLIQTPSTATTDALIANSMLQTCLLDTVISISSMLQGLFRQFIPTLLYPLLSKMNDLNSPSVRSASSSTITVIAKSSNYASPESMLSCNFEYLMEMMATELKDQINNRSDLFSQGYCFYSLHSVIKNIMNYENKEHIEPQSLETRILLTVSLLSAMGMWFNRNFRKTTQELLQSIIVPQSLIRVYLSTFTQLNLLLDSDKLEVEPLYEDNFRWTLLLEEFHKNQHFKSETDQVVDGANEKDTFKISLNIAKKLITCADAVLMINSVLLSLPDLKLQCESLDLMKEVYKLLAAIQNMVKVNKSSTNDSLVDIGNPLLQHAHRYWLPLKSNLKSTVDSYLYDNAYYEIGNARCHLAALLCNLVNVISTLSIYCVEFLAEKIEKDIFPLFSRVLDAFLKSARDLTLTENDQDVFVAISNCLEKLFSKCKLGIALQTSIPSLSALIVPFLGNEGTVGDKAFETLKTILAVKFDFSLRSLYHLSGTKFPERPILHQITPEEDNVLRDERSNILRNRCLDLIHFIEKEPELPLY